MIHDEHRKISIEYKKFYHDLHGKISKLCFTFLVVRTYENWMRSTLTIAGANVRQEHHCIAVTLAAVHISWQLTLTTISLHNSELVLVWQSLAKKSCEIVLVLEPVKTDPRSGQVVGAQKQVTSPVVEVMLHGTVLLAFSVEKMSHARNQSVCKKYLRVLRALEPLNSMPHAYRCSMVLVHETWDVSQRPPSQGNEVK